MTAIKLIKIAHKFQNQNRKIVALAMVIMVATGALASFANNGEARISQTFDSRIGTLSGNAMQHGDFTSFTNMNAMDHNMSNMTSAQPSALSSGTASAVCADGLISSGLPATAYSQSSVQKDMPNLTAKKAFDNGSSVKQSNRNLDSRWSSEFSDVQWIQVNLGKLSNITCVQLNWEDSYARDYNIEVATNINGPFTAIKQIRNQNGYGLKTFTTDTQAQFLRIQILKRATQYGSSLWEVQVRGSAATKPSGSPITNPVISTSGVHPLLTGDLQVPKTAPYAFYFYSKGGIRVSLDGKLLIDDWENQSTIAKKNVLYYTLTAGRISKIVVQYNRSSPNEVVAKYSLAGQGEKLLEPGIIKPSNSTPTPQTVPPTTPVTQPVVTPPTSPSIPPIGSTACDGTKALGKSSIISFVPESKTNYTVWLNVRGSKKVDIGFDVDKANCNRQQYVLNNTTNFTWVSFAFKQNISKGNHNLGVYSFIDGFDFRKGMIISDGCVPAGDGSNCLTAITPSPTNPPVTVPPTSPVTAPITSPVITPNPPVTMPTSGKMGSNAAVAKYRYTDPRYSTYPNIASAQLPLDKLLVGGNPQFEWFKFNGLSPSNGQNGQFRTWCDFSHLSYDDPIVYPGQPEKAHLHTFFGNTGTNAYSTPQSILNSGGSTCDGQELNRTAYWFPTMMDSSGNARVPNQMIVYYKGEGITPPAGGYTAIPEGLKMLAYRDPIANNGPGYGYNSGWGCSSSMFNNPQFSTIPNCNGPGNRLTQKVLYPRCWDGVNLDSANHKTHVVYPSGYFHGTCPSSHPKVLTEISVLFQWNLSNESTAGWKLSSDMMAGPNTPPGSTAHGDYMVGWNRSVINSWNQNCLNTEWNCQTQFISNKPNMPLSLPGGQYNMLKSTALPFIEKGPLIYNPRG